MSPSLKPEKNDFHRERSLFIDAFATLEEALLLDSKPDPLDKKAGELLKSLRAIRNDLVHSRLQFVNLDGGLRAVAVNAQHARQIARSGRILAIDDFKVLKSQVAELKRSLG